MNPIGAPDVAMEQTPPQNLEAEQSVLGGILLSKEAMADVVGILRANDFYKPAHETIFTAATHLYAAGEPVDAITVAAQLSTVGELTRIGGAEYLHELIAAVPSAASAGYYARLVRDKATLRGLTTAATRIFTTAQSAEGDVDDIVDQAQGDIFAVTERRDSDDYHPISDTMEATLVQIDAAATRDGHPTGVLTGFTQLDELTGGLQHGTMNVLAARPAIGKSTLGLDFCREAAIRGGVTTVLFSLEMTRDEITKRILSAEANVPLTHLTRGPMGPEDWEKVATTAGTVAKAPLFIDDSPHLTLMVIRAKCRRLKQRHNLGLVVIDYLQLLSSGRRFENRQQEVAEFSRTLKLLAKELDIPVVAISQLNRGPEQRANRTPVLSDMRESGAIEQDADLVLLLHRDDAYDKDIRPGLASLAIAKHRSGPTAVFDLLFNKEHAHFTSLPPEI